MNHQEILDLLKKNRDELLPTGREITASAIDKVLANNRNNFEWVKSHFSELVERAQNAAYEIYLAEEGRVAPQAIRRVFGKLLPPKPTAKNLFDLLDANFPALDKFFLSLSQSRRARAGRAFEHVIKVLFNLLGYPYTQHPVINGNPDFLLPNEEHFRNNAMDCIIFTVKRTLRERWRQIVTEGTRGYLFFLATIDEKITTSQLSQICNHRIYVVVPDRIKSEVYEGQSNVISFELFFEQHLDPAMNRWRKNKIIP